MIRRLVVIALVVAVLGIAIADTYRYATAQQHLGSTTYDLATWAAQNASAFDRDQMANKLAADAAAEGITVYQYGQTDNAVQVWTESKVEGTFVAGLVVNLLRGASFSEALGSSFIIRDYQEAGV